MMWRSVRPHGHCFQVDTGTGHRLFKDVVRVAPMNQFAVDTMADNPGQWFFPHDNPSGPVALAIRRNRIGVRRWAATSGASAVKPPRLSRAAGPRFLVKDRDAFGTPRGVKRLQRPGRRGGFPRRGQGFHADFCPRGSLARLFAR